MKANVKAKVKACVGCLCDVAPGRQESGGGLTPLTGIPSPRTKSGVFIPITCFSSVKFKH